MQYIVVFQYFILSFILYKSRNRIYTGVTWLCCVVSYTSTVSRELLTTYGPTNKQMKLMTIYAEIGATEPNVEMNKAAQDSTLPDRCHSH